MIFVFLNMLLIDYIYSSDILPNLLFIILDHATRQIYTIYISFQSTINGKKFTLIRYIQNVINFNIDIFIVILLFLLIYILIT